MMSGIVSIAQSDLQKMVDTEHAFAAKAAVDGTKAAFLANMTDDAVVFNPDKMNAKAFWSARGESKSLLSWAPNYADISSNGILGYTTGNWEFRAKGKDDAPAAFGEFITLWQRQSDGTYKFILDIGVGHEKPANYSTEWKTAAAAAGSEKMEPTSDAAAAFYQLQAKKGTAKAYETYADDNIRCYRDEKLPILGKKDAIKMLKADKAKTVFAKRSTTFTADNISYSLNTYTKSLDGKEVEKGNFVQIWKFSGGKWRIVLDVFAPLPAK